MTQERWLPVPVPEVAKFYEVSDCGRVRAKIPRRSGTRPNQILKPIFCKGYARVILCNKPLRIQCSIHRLVLTAFLGPCPENHAVNHLNGIKSDNRLENLEWATHSENISHAHRTGLIPKKIRIPKPKEPDRRFKLTEADVLEIRRLCTEKKMTQWAIAKQFGIGQAAVSHIHFRRTWKHL